MICSVMLQFAAWPWMAAFCSEIATTSTSWAHSASALHWLRAWRCLIVNLHLINLYDVYYVKLKKQRKPHLNVQCSRYSWVTIL
jgi:hypothetical protein